MREKPNIIERLRLTWRFATSGIDRIYEQRGAIERKKAPYIFPVWRGGQPEWHIVDLDSYVREGFNLNTLIYSAIMYKAKAMSTATLRAYTGDPDMPELLKPDHPLSKLVQRPNPSQSQREYHMLQQVYLNLAGNAYGLLDRQRKGELPQAIYPMNPLRIYIIPDTKKVSGGAILGYLYVPEGKSFDDGKPILPEDMMHTKFPNPADPLDGLGYGLPPISPLARSGDVDNMVTDFIKRFFESGTMLHTYVTYDMEMDEDTLANAQERFMEKYSGYTNWSETPFFDAGGKVQRFGMTFDEMGFNTLDERNETRILGPFGVPLTLIATRSGMSAATYNNKELDRRMFWEDTMTAEIGLFEDDYQYYLQTDDGGFVAFDLSDVPALKKDVPVLAEAAYKIWQMGVPANDAFSMVGINTVGEIPSGALSFIPLGMVQYQEGAPPPAIPGQPAPASEPSMAESEEATEDERDENTNGNKQLLLSVKAWTPDQKKALWLKADRTATSFEPRFRDEAKRQFENDKREILAMLNEAKQKSLQQKQTINWETLITDVTAYLVGRAGETWRQAFIPLITGVVQEASSFWSQQLGMQFDVRNLMAEQFLRDYTLTFADPISDTSAGEIKELLSQAQAEGWSIPKAQNGLTTLFEQWTEGTVSPEDWAFAEQRLPPHRTEMIARTETMRSYNSSSNAIFKEAGVTKKEWLSTRDDRTRTYGNTGGKYDHLVADGQQVPVDQPFTVSGESLMFPHDPNGSLGNTIYCRCTEIPVI